MKIHKYVDLDEAIKAVCRSECACKTPCENPCDIVNDMISKAESELVTFSWTLCKGKYVKPCKYEEVIITLRSEKQNKSITQTACMGEDGIWLEDDEGWLRPVEEHGWKVVAWTELPHPYLTEKQMDELI